MNQSDPAVQDYLKTFVRVPAIRPLTRDEQKQAFEARIQQYKFTDPSKATTKPAVPQLAFQPMKEYRLSEKEQLEAAKTAMAERGLKESVQKVEERLEEKHTTDTIKQFYCSHSFQVVKVKLAVLPVKQKICSKCGLVK